MIHKLMNVICHTHDIWCKFILSNWLCVLVLTRSQLCDHPNIVNIYIHHTIRHKQQGCLTVFVSPHLNLYLAKSNTMLTILHIKVHNKSSRT